MVHVTRICSGSHEESRFGRRWMVQDCRLQLGGSLGQFCPSALGRALGFGGVLAW
jgi:hypothetical protein